MFKELKIKNKRKENTKKNTKMLIGWGEGGGGGGGGACSQTHATGKGWACW